MTQAEENGRIVLHKSLFNQKKEPYAKLDDIRLKETSSEGGVSSISRADESAPAISLESRDDVISGSKVEALASKSDGLASEDKDTNSASDKQEKGGEGSMQPTDSEDAQGVQSTWYGTADEAPKTSLNPRTQERFFNDAMEAYKACSLRHSTFDSIKDGNEAIPFDEFVNEYREAVPSITFEKTEQYLKEYFDYFNERLEKGLEDKRAEAEKQREAQKAADEILPDETPDNRRGNQDAKGEEPTPTDSHSDSESKDGPTEAELNEKADKDINGRDNAEPSSDDLENYNAQNREEDTFGESIPQTDKDKAPAAQEKADDDRADYEADQRQARDESDKDSFQAQIDAEKESDTQFRMSDEPVTPTHVERVLDSAREHGVQVIENVDELPTDHAAYTPIRRGLNVKGWYDPKTGKVYVYKPNIESVEDLMETLRHEGVAHLGLRELVGRSEFGGLCDRVWDGAMSEADRARYMAYVNDMSLKDYMALSDAERKALDNERNRRAVADEFMAHLSESGDYNDVSMWKRIVAWVRDMLNSKLGLNLKVNNNDIKNLLRRSESNLSENGMDMKAIEEAGESLSFRTSEDIERDYPNWLDGTTTESGKHSTQVEGTRKTYGKLANWIESHLGKDVKILDASSGMGYGTSDLRERGFDIDDVEPYQSESRRVNNPATYDSYDKVKGEYDIVISNAVLNVVPDDWRADLLHNMASKLKDGGRIFINTRKAGEEKGIKDKIELDSPQEVLVKRNGRIVSYQRFFTPLELKAWVESELGDGYRVEVANEANSGTKGLAAVVVTKNNESLTKSETPGLGLPIAKADAPMVNFDANVRKNQQFAKELENLINFIGNKGSLGAHEFLYSLAKSFGIENESFNEHAYVDLDGGVSLRIADHYGNAKNFADKSHAENNLGIVIKLKLPKGRKSARFKDYEGVDYLEYVFFPDKISSESRQQDIVRGLQDYLTTRDIGKLPTPDKYNGSGKFKDEAKRLNSELSEANGEDVRFQVKRNEENDKKLYNPRGMITPVRGEWTKSKIKTRLKEMGGSQVGVKAAARIISEFDSPEELAEHMFYHGTAYGGGHLRPSILMSDRDVERYGGGGYGEKYWGISVSKSKRIASNFSGTSNNVRILPIILAKGAKVIEMPELQDASDLDEHITQLWRDGVDAVWIGNRNSKHSEQELCVLNPKAIVNIDTADFYKVFGLGSEKNPLRIVDEEGVKNLYDAARRFNQQMKNAPKEPLKPSRTIFDNEWNVLGHKDADTYEREMAEYDNALKEYENSDAYKEYRQAERDAYNAIRFRIADNEQSARLNAKQKSGKTVELDEKMFDEADADVFEVARREADLADKIRFRVNENGQREPRSLKDVITERAIALAQQYSDNAELKDNALKAIADNIRDISHGNSESKDGPTEAELNEKAEPQPIGKGVFGNIYDQFKGKVKEAIEFLASKESGEALGALHHKQIGDISLVWGNKKGGLDKILSKHPEVIDDLQSIINGMNVVEESDNRIKLESATHFAVVSKDWMGSPRDNWLLTAYEKKETSASIDKTMDTDENPTGLRGDTALSQNADVSSSKGNTLSAEKQEGGGNSSVEMSSEAESAAAEAPYTVTPEVEKQLAEREASTIEPRPIMQQYKSMKAKHPDAVLLFEIGDFYETFSDDAAEVSRILGTTLTKRSGVNLTTFPRAAFDSYVRRIAQTGRRVVVAERTLPDVEKPTSKKNQSDTQFRMSDEPVTPTHVERVLDSAREHGVQVIENVDELPTDHAAYTPIRRGLNVKGWYDPKTGKVYVYKPNIESVEDLMETLRHEGVAHLGLRELVGRSEFGGLCDRVWDGAMSEADRARYMAYVNDMSLKDYMALSDAERKALDNERNRRAAADEFMAHLSESGDYNDVSMWKRIVAWVRDMLNSKLGLNLKVNSNDIKNLLRRSESNLSENGMDMKAIEDAGDDVKLRKDNKKTPKGTAPVTNESGRMAHVAPLEVDAKVLKNIGLLKETYKNNSSHKGRGFITNVSRALGLTGDGSSKYNSFVTQDGKEFTLRVSNHSARVSLFDANGEGDAVSIVIESNQWRCLINDGEAHVVEYKYKKRDLDNADSNAYVLIIESIEDMMRTGEYEDKTGLAEVTEANGSDTRFRFIGEKGAERLDKAEEATMRLDNLGVARQMENAEKEAHDIKLATGWERGADGKWRYETGDFAINEAMLIGSESQQMEQRYKELKAEDKTLQNKKERLWREYDLLPKRGRNDEQQKRARGINKAVKEIIKQQNNVADEMRKLENKYRNYERGRVKLSELISNDNGLFDAYPKLRDLPVSIQKMPRGMRGSEHSDGQGNVVLIRLNQDMNPAETRETLVHEIQHAIQDIEGFAQGGNPIALKDAAGEKFRNTRRELERVANDAGYSLSEVKKPDFATDNAELKAAIEQYNKASDVYFGADFYERYHNLGGEVEALNAANRIDMSDEQRRESLASDTEDVAREDQIFLMDNLGESAMGSKVHKRMREIAERLENTDLDERQRAVVDVFTGAKDNKRIEVNREDGRRTIIMRQGNEDGAGTKHSLYRHYGTGTGVINADDLKLIPKVIEVGELSEKQRGSTKLNEYKYSDEKGATYTVVTERKKGNELFNTFYSNKKVIASGTSRRAQSDANTPEGAHTDKAITSDANLANNSENQEFEAINNPNAEQKPRFRIADNEQSARLNAKQKSGKTVELDEKMFDEDDTDVFEVARREADSADKIRFRVNENGQREPRSLKDVITERAIALAQQYSLGGVNTRKSGDVRAMEGVSELYVVQHS